MLPSAFLEGERKSGVIWYMIFRQSPCSRGAFRDRTISTSGPRAHAMRLRHYDRIRADLAAVSRPLPGGPRTGLLRRGRRPARQRLGRRAPRRSLGRDQAASWPCGACSTSSSSASTPLRRQPGRVVQPVSRASPPRVGLKTTAHPPRRVCPIAQRAVSVAIDAVQPSPRPALLG